MSETQLPIRIAISIGAVVLVLCARMCVAADENAAPANSDARRVIRLINQNEELTAELGKLRGQLDELLNSIDKTRKQQREMYRELSNRLERIEREQKTAAPGDEAINMLKARMQQLEESLAALRAKLFGSSGDNSDADPAYRAYGAGLEAIRSGDYAAAVEAFQQFLQQRPDDSYAAEAQYWMGEALFKERQYASAIAAQKKLIADHPDSARTADALLVIGSAELGLGNVESAREAWETLINGHPNSEAAGKARKRLERIH